MITRSKTKKTLLAGLVTMFGAFAWAAPAGAGYPMHGGWGGHHFARPFPVVHRRVVVHRPYVVRRSNARRIVIIERPIVRRPRFVGHPVHVHHPRRPIYRDRPWRERRRCFLPERYLCR